MRDLPKTSDDLTVNVGGSYIVKSYGTFGTIWIWDCGFGSDAQSIGRRTENGLAFFPVHSQSLSLSHSSLASLFSFPFTVFGRASTS